MAVRQLWIIALPTHEKGKLLFHRSFPTVEKQAKVYEAERYEAPPGAEEFAQSFLQAIGLSTVQEDDEFSRDDQTPVCEVRCGNRTLWPVLFIEQHGLIHCCLPLVKQGAHSRPPLVTVDGVSVGFTLLLAMADFLGSTTRILDKTSPKLAELSVFLNQAAPFGTPTEVLPSRLKALSAPSKGTSQTSQKQPSWKPALHKGKASLQFHIKEQIRAVQYDRKGVPDVWDVYGTVTCRAELEGMSPEVTLTLGHCDSSAWTPFENLLFHPCVQSFQSQSAILPRSSRKNRTVDSCRIRILPNLESFPLCHYTANLLRELPIDGFYQMKGEKVVELLVQLKLDERVRNNFEFCELQIPFFHRGPIVNFEANASHGQVVASPDKSFLDWNLGTRFPAKTLEVMLKATVYFSKYEASPGNRFDEQFCIGSNSYAQLFFKISDFTLSGASIDAKSVHVSPSVKFKCSLGRELVSAEYKIWNSHGDAPIAYNPSYEDLKLLHATNSGSTEEN